MDAELPLDGFQPAVVPQPATKKTDVQVWLVDREIRILTQQHREIERRSTKRHEQIILTERFGKPTGG
jgi:hypothetical protein